MKKKVSKKAFDMARTPIGEIIIGIAFSRFSKFLPTSKVKETDKAVAFWHPKPSYEKHILIVPKRRIKNLTSLKSNDFQFLAHSLETASRIARDLEWNRENYRLILNGGTNQKVNQLHFHLISGHKIH